MPGPVQELALNLHVAGESNKEIARVEEINEKTITCVLSQPDMQERLEASGCGFAELVPLALRVYRDALLSGTEHAAKHVLDGNRVAVTRAEQQVVKRLEEEFSGWSEEGLDRYTATGERPGAAPSSVSAVAPVEPPRKPTGKA